jgi:hypothetical protein
MPESFIQLPPDSTGKKLRTIEETIGGHVVHTEFFQFRQLPTFIAHVVDITPAANAFLLAILNRNAGKVVRVWRANMFISSETAVTGVLLKARLVRISATVPLSGGTAVTPTQMDTNDSLPANIDIQTRPTSGITVVSEFGRFLLSSDEAVVSTLDADAFSAEVFPRDLWSLYDVSLPMTKPLTLRTDGTTFQGFAIQNLVGAVGFVGIRVLFTVSDE